MRFSYSSVYTMGSDNAHSSKTALYLVVKVVATAALTAWILNFCRSPIEKPLCLETVTHRLSLHNTARLKNNVPVASTPFLDLLDTIPDARFRATKLIGNTKLGPISMWVAIPTNDSIVPGASWYNPLWGAHEIGGALEVDDLISISPCRPSDVFIQVGAHLGIYPLIASYRGCRSIAVEAMPLAANFSRISAALNNWGPSRFLSINAAGGAQRGSVWFDPLLISISVNNDNNERKVHVPMTTLDDVNALHVLPSQSQITLIIIDVERHEQAVILGARELIQQKSVAIFQIEMWTSHSVSGPIKDFSGIQLLMDNGYRIYTTAANSKMNHSTCDIVTHLPNLIKIINEGSSCLPSSNPNLDCLAEVYALRKDIPPLRNWYSSCRK